MLLSLGLTIHAYADSATSDWKSAANWMPNTVPNGPSDVATFHNLRDGQIITVNGSNLEASYTGGDGNDLTLTVVS